MEGRREHEAELRRVDEAGEMRGWQEGQEMRETTMGELKLTSELVDAFGASALRDEL